MYSVEMFGKVTRMTDKAMLFEALSVNISFFNATDTAAMSTWWPISQIKACDPSIEMVGELLRDGSGSVLVNMVVPDWLVNKKLDSFAKAQEKAEGNSEEFRAVTNRKGEIITRLQETQKMTAQIPSEDWIDSYTKEKRREMRELDRLDKILDERREKTGKKIAEKLCGVKRRKFYLDDN